MPAMAAGMMGAQGQSGRNLLLQLGSQQAASGEPKAEHDIPPGMNMGPMLPLVTPRREPVERPSATCPEGMERPRGRMLLYWGCGENVRAGQPVVIDFAGVAEGKTPPNLVSRRIAHPAGPASGRSKTYGDWPNHEQPKAGAGRRVAARRARRSRATTRPRSQFALDKDFLDKRRARGERQQRALERDRRARPATSPRCSARRARTRSCSGPRAKCRRWAAR